MRKQILAIAMMISLFSFSYSSKNFLYEKLDPESSEQGMNLQKFCHDQSCPAFEENRIWLIYVKAGALAGVLAATLWESSDNSKRILLSRELIFTEEEELEMKLAALGVFGSGVNELSDKEETCPAYSIASFMWIIGAVTALVSVPAVVVWIKPYLKNAFANRQIIFREQGSSGFTSLAGATDGSRTVSPAPEAPPPSLVYQLRSQRRTTPPPMLRHDRVNKQAVRR